MRKEGVWEFRDVLLTSARRKKENLCCKPFHLRRWPVRFLGVYKTEGREGMSSRFSFPFTPTMPFRSPVIHPLSLLPILIPHPSLLPSTVTPIHCHYYPSTLVAHAFSTIRTRFPFCHVTSKKGSPLLVGAKGKNAKICGEGGNVECMHFDV